ncbi:MAG TPA: hypothetical protein VFF03_05645 [Rhodocyclaceae bacterium]|nr:hypothetical protein [Rhodocyclaceae bacterium]
MSQRKTSIAFAAALWLAHGLVYAESAPVQAPTQGAAAFGYADSFGLNGMRRAVPGKGQGMAAPAAGSALPAADSFGLNNGIMAAAAGCPASAKTARNGPRCIEI